MSKTTTTREPVPAANEVCLVGRVSRDPEERTLPSGDRLVTFRVIVPRTSGRTTGQSPGRERAQVDALECAAWSKRAQRSVLSWSADDVVEVHGALRRRFFRGEGGGQSRVEVEMSRGRLIRRPTSA